MGGLAVGRSKQTCELTSSIVPRGTPFHRLVDLEFPPNSDLVGCSRGNFPGRSKLRAINPDAVQITAKRRASATIARFRPRRLAICIAQAFDPRPSRRTHQHDLGRLVEHGPHHLVATARYGARSVSFSRLIPGARQPKHRTDGFVAISDDIFGTGWVKSLAEPGGNVTGLTIMSPELSVKRLEILQEMVPGLSHVAVLADPTISKSQVAR